MAWKSPYSLLRKTKRLCLISLGLGSGRAMKPVVHHRPRPFIVEEGDQTVPRLKEKMPETLVPDPGHPPHPQQVPVSPDRPGPEYLARFTKLG